MAPSSSSSMADADALKTHSHGPAIGALFARRRLLDGDRTSRVLQPGRCGRPRQGASCGPDERSARSENANGFAPRQGRAFINRAAAVRAARGRSGWRPTARTSSRSTSATRSPRCPIRWPLRTIRRYGQARRGQPGARIVAHQADVRDRDSFGHCVAWRDSDELGRLDIVVANAGIAPMASGADGWRMSSNRRQPHWRVQQRRVASSYRTARWGSIVLISSAGRPDWNREPQRGRNRIHRRQTRHRRV